MLGLLDARTAVVYTARNCVDASGHVLRDRFMMCMAECLEELQGQVQAFKTKSATTKLIFLNDVVNTSDEPINLSGAVMEFEESFLVFANGGQEQRPSSEFEMIDCGPPSTLCAMLQHPRGQSPSCKPARLLS
eukprot:scaffold227_cov309-Prasinococcus_capsulatus_cf.AAC.4